MVALALFTARPAARPVDHYGTVFSSLYDGSGAGLMAALAITLAPLGALLTLAVALRPKAQTFLLSLALTLGSLALITTKFPTEVPGKGAPRSSTPRSGRCTCSAARSGSAA